MREYVELGPAPAEENCKQVGRDAPDEIRAECRQYVELLRKKFPIPEGADAYFSVKSFSHDFGSYPEAVVSFNGNCELSCEFAYFVEKNLPGEWADDEVIPFTPVPREEYAEGY